MLKILVKKQLTEIFRSYFYDAKNNKARLQGRNRCIPLLFRRFDDSGAGREYSPPWRFPSVCRCPLPGQTGSILP